MIISELHSQCKMIAEKHDLNVRSIEVAHRQHYGDYIGHDSPLYIEVTTFYTCCNTEKSNFTVNIGNSDKDRFSMELLLARYEEMCILAKQESLPEMEKDKMNADLENTEVAI